MLKWCVLLAAVAIGAGCASSPTNSANLSDAQLLDHTHEIQREAPLIDGHNDLPWEIRKNAGGDLTRMDPRGPLPNQHTDIPRLKQGGVGAVFFAAYIPYSAYERHMAARMTIEQIDLIHRMVELAESLEFATTADDVERIHRSGKIAVLIGIESGHAIENSLPLLRQYYELGARYMTLTHTSTIDWADSANDEHRHGGLTPFGEEVVREMNRLGMLVDLSHVSDDTMRDALRVTEAPIIFSHSSARALAGDQPRDVPDDILQLTRDNGGVVMVNFFSGYLLPEVPGRKEELTKFREQLRQQYGDGEATDAVRRAKLREWNDAHPLPRGDVKTVADHIDHIVKVAGIDHVGLGSDFDGVGTVPVGLDDVSKYPNLTAELLRRGYSEPDIKKILGGNVLRVMRDVETIAKHLRATRTPSMATTQPAEMPTTSLTTQGGRN